MGSNCINKSSRTRPRWEMRHTRRKVEARSEAIDGLSSLLLTAAQKGSAASSGGKIYVILSAAAQKEPYEVIWRAVIRAFSWFLKRAMDAEALIAEPRFRNDHG